MFFFFFGVTEQFQKGIHSVSAISNWSYVMKNSCKGKRMWKYVSGTSVKFKNTDKGYAALIDV
jgi:ribosomal protein S11